MVLPHAREWQAYRIARTTLCSLLNIGANEEFPPLLTVCMVAKRLRVDDSTVRRWIKNGVLEAITLPQAEDGERLVYRIKQSVLDALL